MVPQDVSFRTLTSRPLESPKRYHRSARQRLALPAKPLEKNPVDKKAKKRIEVLRKKQEMLVKQIAGAKKQLDDPEELRKFEAELAAVLKEISDLQK